MVGVSLRSVTKHFGDTQVLHGIDAEIEAGAFAVLVGPSGCGKSTLLRLLAGLETVSSGTIHFGDRDVTSLAPRERDLAMVFQSYALYPHMTVRDNIAFGLRLRKLDPAAIATRVDEVADMLGLQPLLDRHPRQLSGGQRQRVAMGRAIAKRSKLFLFDEPLSNLDPALRNQVRVDIRRLHDKLGATSVYVTHDQVEAMTLADQLFVLDAGVVQQTGRPLDLYRRPANRFVAGFVGSPAMNFIHGVVVDVDGRPGLAVQGADDREHPLVITIGAPQHFVELGPGREVTLGVRPQDVALVDSHPDVQARATVVETLGPDIHVHATLAGQPFVACLDAEAGVTRNDTLGLRLTSQHLFDRHSGETLRRPLDP